MTLRFEARVNRGMLIDPFDRKKKMSREKLGSKSEFCCSYLKSQTSFLPTSQIKNPDFWLSHFSYKHMHWHLSWNRPLSIVILHIIFHLLKNVLSEGILSQVA